MLQAVTHGRQPSVERLLPLHALVGPVRGQAVLGDIVHPLRADLHLDEVSLLVLDCNVQGLVAIGLGVGQPVAQARRVRLVFLGHIRIDLPAEVQFLFPAFLAVDDEAHRKHIIDTLERHALRLHLAVNRVGRLGPDLQCVPDAQRRELLGQRLHELPREPFPVRFRGLEFIGDGAPGLRVRITEPDVLHFALDVVEPQLMRQRDIQEQGFEQFLLPRHLGEQRQVPHNLQPVGNLDDRRPRVRRAAHNQALVILRLELRILRADGRNHIQPLGEHAHFLRERGEVRFGVLPAGFVQVDGGQAVVPEADFLRDDFRHRVRVLDKRMPVAPDLVFQGFQRKCARFTDQRTERHTAAFFFSAARLFSARWNSPALRRCSL